MKEKTDEGAWPGLAWSVAVTILLSLAGAAAPSANLPGVSDSVQPVGLYSSADHLVFVGNHSYAGSEIRRALMAQLPFYLSRRPGVLLSNYLNTVGALVAEGYRQMGFVAASVSVAAIPASNRVEVRIVEGNRFQMGDVLVSGVGSMTNEAFRRALVEALKPPLLSEGAASVTSYTHWQKGSPGSFSVTSRQMLSSGVAAALMRLGHFGSEQRLSLSLDTNLLQVHLNVNIINPGTTGLVSRIGFTGLRQQSAKEVMRFLGLREGMVLESGLLEGISNRLYSSGRFLSESVEIYPRTKPGEFTLDVRCKEVPGATPIGQPLSEKEHAILRFKEWLEAWARNPTELVIEVASHVGRRWIGSRGVLSESGVMGVVLGSEGTTMPTAGFVVGSELIGVYSIAHGRKFVSRGFGQGWEPQLEFRVTGPPEGSSERGHFSFGLGWRSVAANRRPAVRGGLSVRMDLAPGPFVSLVTEGKFTLTNGLCRVEPDRGPDTQITLEFDAASGVLRQFSSSSAGLKLTIAPKRGEFIRLASQMQKATVLLEEWGRASYLADQVGFVLCEAIDTLSSLTNEQIEDWTEALDEHSNDRSEVRLMLQSIRDWLQANRSLVPSSQSMLAFAQRVSNSLPSSNGEEVMPGGDFQIPSSDDSTSSLMTVLLGNVLSMIDTFAPDEAWPANLLRAVALIHLGHPEEARGYLDPLLLSDGGGPLACLAGALAVGNPRPGLSRSFAEHGLERLAWDGFRKDWIALGNTNTPLGMVVRTLQEGFLEQAEPGRLLCIAAALKAEAGGFLTGFLSVLNRAATKADDPTALKILEAAWTPALQPALKRALSSLLPLPASTADAGTAFGIGAALLAENLSFRQTSEAMRWLTRAAELGETNATHFLAAAYEAGIGLPHDMAKAIELYHRAADSLPAHAACRLGDIHAFGAGVLVNIPEAIRWYRKGADAGCAESQVKLADTLSAGLQWTEALLWYRIAATNGHRGAMLTLGQLLTDGFAVPTDRVEAFQWLGLAAAIHNDPLLSSELSRLAAKIGTEQSEDAELTVRRLLTQLGSKPPDAGSSACFNPFRLPTDPAESTRIAASDARRQFWASYLSEIRSAPAIAIPARLETGGPGLVDLTDHYNVSLKEAWHQGALDSTLSEVPLGIHQFGGTEFDVRGVIQVGFRDLKGRPYPSEVGGIRIGRHCAKIQFLHSAINCFSVKEPLKIGMYRIRYSDGNVADVPIVATVDVGDWYEPRTPETWPWTVVWRGENEHSRKQGRNIRLFKSTWNNPTPEREVASVDMVSLEPIAVPFLLGLTTE